MITFYCTMVNVGRYQLLDVPAHWRTQVAQELGREDELKPPEPPVPDPIPDPEEEENTAPAEEEEKDDTESDDPEEGDSPPVQD